MGRRRQKTGHRGTFLIGFIILLALCASVFLVIQYGFKITQVNITGSDHYTYEELYQYLFQDRNDTNMIFYMWTDQRAEAVEIPFIAKIETEKQFPGTLNFTVYEKNMIGYVEYQGCKMYFDKDGVIVESSQELLEGVPRVDGLDFSQIVMYQKLDVGQPEIFAAIQNLNQYLDKYGIYVEEIAVSSKYGFSIQIDDVTVALGTKEESFSAKIYELSCMLKELEGRKGTLDMTDYDGNSDYITFTETE